MQSLALPPSEAHTSQGKACRDKQSLHSGQLKRSSWKRQDWICGGRRWQQKQLYLPPVSSTASRRWACWTCIKKSPTVASEKPARACPSKNRINEYLRELALGAGQSASVREKMKGQAAQGVWKKATLIKRAGPPHLRCTEE